jgi:cytochrome c biogenesis protein
VQLLGVFADGGYAAIAKMIETSVPQDQREKAAKTYIKIMTSAAFEAYQTGQERAGIKSTNVDEQTQSFLQDSLNAMSDLFYYGAPVYLELTKFEQREASGLQLTRSPGKNLVYLGSVLLVLGIFAMIYIRERRVWLLVKPKSKTVLFAMSANRKNRDFEMEFGRYQSQLKNLLES